MLKSPTTQQGRQGTLRDRYLHRSRDTDNSGGTGDAGASGNGMHESLDTKKPREEGGPSGAPEERYKSLDTGTPRERGRAALDRRGHMLPASCRWCWGEAEPGTRC